MQALLDTEALVAVFSGHDHGDDWCFRWEGRLGDMELVGNGVRLCFSRHTGYGGVRDVDEGGEADSGEAGWGWGGGGDVDEVGGWECCGEGDAEFDVWRGCVSCCSVELYG